MTTEAKIRRFLAKGVSADEIAKKLGISKNRVYTVRWKEAKKTVKPKKVKSVEKQVHDIKAEAWKERNPWFGVNEQKTAAALAYHDELLNDGIAPTSDEYWDKVDAKFGSKSNKRQTRLTPTQVALAKKLGISNEQYAREITELFDLSKTDPVNHPEHYKVGGIEVIDFIEAKDLNYRLGNVVKYISRAGKKNTDPVKDLEKAAWYLQREIDARKGA
jgi:transposase